LDAVGARRYFFVQRAEDGVVLQQVRQCFDVRQVVGGDELNFRVVHASPDNIPADAAEAIDTYFDSHIGLGLLMGGHFHDSRMAHPVRPHGI
jgi:hypothetical protein